MAKNTIFLAVLSALSCHIFGMDLPNRTQEAENLYNQAQCEDNREKKRAYMRQSAELGYSLAQIAMARFYVGMVATDEHEKSSFRQQAAYWYEKAAQQNSIEAQLWLYRYFVELSFTFNQTSPHLDSCLKEAVRWSKAASDQGDPAGHYHYGHALRLQARIAQNDTERVRLLWAAYDCLTSPRAQSLVTDFDLGRLFVDLYCASATGDIVEDMFNRALLYFQLFLDTGNLKIASYHIGALYAKAFERATTIQEKDNHFQKALEYFFQAHVAGDGYAACAVQSLLQGALSTILDPQFCLHARILVDAWNKKMHDHNNAM